MQFTLNNVRLFAIHSGMQNLHAFLFQNTSYIKNIHKAAAKHTKQMHVSDQHNMFFKNQHCVLSNLQHSSA